MKINKVTRFEVIDNTGRVYSEWNCKIRLSLQDEERTLKVFVDKSINLELWNELLGKHKKLIFSYGKGEHDEDLLVQVINTGEELSLVYSKFKCENCSATEDLQFHHMITKNHKKYTDFIRYETQRRYWANILILCKACHGKLHGRNYILENKCLPKKRIDKLKRKYGGVGK